MAVVALVIYVCFILLVDVLRSWIHRHRTGDFGLRVSFRPVGSPQWWASLTMAAGALLGIAAPVAELLGTSALPALDHAPMRISGAVAAGIGMFAVLGAQLAMGSSWRIGVDETERTRLVTTGPFRVVRNPIFTAGLGTIGGLVLTVPNVVAIVGFVILGVGVELQVRLVEEPYLRRVHGSVYDGYAAAVGRFIPGVGHTRRS